MRSIKHYSLTRSGGKIYYTKMNIDTRKRPLITDCVEVIETNLKRPKSVSFDKSSNKTQLHLDLGQKTFGHVCCKICGMVYTFGQPEDQVEHYKFHKNLTNGISFQGWKEERVIETCTDGRIILVLPTDSKKHLKKIYDICKVIDAELGYSFTDFNIISKLKSFLYICQKKVIGCVMVQNITEGYRVIINDHLDTRQDSTECPIWYCSDISEPAVMGVCRIWILPSHRKKGIGTHLLETARNNFMFDYVVPKSLIAFSDPTPDGKHFATKFCETSNFLIYRWTM